MQVVELSVSAFRLGHLEFLGAGVLELLLMLTGLGLQLSHGHRDVLIRGWAFALVVFLVKRSIDQGWRL